jgi:hypothetical protein
MEGKQKMVKKYPWQKWPDKDKKDKKKSNYHGQTNEPSWKESSLESLRQHGILKKFHIVETNNLPEGYVGINYYGAKSEGIPFPYPKNTILIRKGLEPDYKQTTIRHETREFYLEEGGLNHDEAHRIAEQKD